MNDFRQGIQGVLTWLRRLDRPMIFIIVGGGIIFFMLLIVLLSKNEVKKPERIDVATKDSRKEIRSEQGDLFLSDEVDRKAYVERLEGQYHLMEEKNGKLEKQMTGLSGRMEEMVRSSEIVSRMLADMDGRLQKLVNDVALRESEVDAATGGKTGAVEFEPGRYQLAVVNISSVKKKEEGEVYLPPGSFVKGTLLTGVYAPADQSNPLPVLIRLKEAFVGPNGSSVPLQGAFVIARATGELNSERALIQASTISSVLPDGKAFEHTGNVGYVTDSQGQLGLKGVVVRNTGAQMAMAFMSGFTGGAAQAFADAETSAQVVDGKVTRNLTGNAGKNAAFSGLAQSAAQLSKYYQDQTSSITPAVKVKAGTDVYLITLEGVAVHGLKQEMVTRASYLD